MARILVERGSVKKLAILFEVSEQTVRNALRYITEGEMPERIREPEETFRYENISGNKSIGESYLSHY